MNTDTKKYLTYGGIAFLVGSLGYFVFSIIRKPSLSVDNTEVLIGTDENLNKPIEDNFAPAQNTNPFSNLNTLPSSIGYKFPSTFNIFS
jgi:hypothetical protein